MFSSLVENEKSLLAIPGKRVWLADTGQPFNDISKPETIQLSKDLRTKKLRTQMANAIYS
jgi:hypothetical protein